MKKVVALTVAAGAVLIAGTSEAQFKGVGKYATAIIENTFPVDPSGFDFVDEKSKVQIKPSGNEGDGGIVVQLNMKFVDCPTETPGNDSGPGTCGPSDAQDPKGVMSLDVIAVGADLNNVAGLVFYLEKGKSRFLATGKNKMGAASFGAVITSVFQQPLGIGRIKVREEGTDIENSTTGCGVIPLPAVNTCTDGILWAFGGIRVGEDQSLSCATTAECDNGGAAPTLICSGGACVPEPCAADVDCDQNGGGSGGTGECGDDGVCCDPANDATCAGQV